MLLLHEVLAERNQEQDTQAPAQERRHEYLHEVHRHPGVLRLQDIERGQREDSTCHDHAARSTDRLNHHILSQCVLALERRRQAYGNDSDRDSRLEHLPHFQPEVSRCSGEDNRHQHTHQHAVWRYFGILLPGFEDRFVLLTLLQRAIGVLWETSLHKRISIRPSKSPLKGDFGSSPFKGEIEGVLVISESSYVRSSLRAAASQGYGRAKEPHRQGCHPLIARPYARGLHRRKARGSASAPCWVCRLH